MKNHILNTIQTTKSFIKKQLHLQPKAIGALLFWVFRTFMAHKTTQQRTKLRDYGYKILNTMPMAGLTLLRLFALSHFTKAFTQWCQQDITYHSKQPLYTWIDGSLLGEHYGNLIPELKTLFDYVKNRYIKTHQIYLLVIQLAGKPYIADFRMYRKESNYGTNKVAQEMLQQFIDSLDTSDQKLFLYHCRLALDGAWGNPQMLKWLEENSFRRVSIKSGGSATILDGCDLRMSLSDWEGMILESDVEFAQTNPRYGLEDVWYHREVVTVEKTNQQIQLILVRFRDEHKVDRHVTLISLAVCDWHAHQVIKAYLVRWGIEVTIRTGKQRFNWGRMAFHLKYPVSEAEKKKDAFRPEVTKPKSFLGREKGKSKREQCAMNRLETFLALRFIAYMVVMWYRIEHTRPSKTSLKDVIERFRLVFDDLSPPAFQSLFVGK
jgi:hypothetical protein